MDIMLQLVYFGRLDQEKGRDAIIAMIEHFAKEETTGLPFVLHIFGKGAYEKKILQLAEQYPQHIIYYGFQPLDTIKKTAATCDYCLMPSLFLETFGLSAVNALSRGLPVIGYQQGGMVPFVLPAYDLASIPGSPAVQLIAMIEKLVAKGGNDESKKCQKIAAEYSKNEWLERFSNFLDPSLPDKSRTGRSGGQKILLVTDFMIKLGGIETYVHDIAALLEEQGYSVVIVGSGGGKTKIGRLLSMFVSFCNVFFAWRLRQKIDDFNPDIIWCHSVLRYIGRLGLHTVNKSSAQKRITYHDLGYFHPFPHAVTDTIQIPASLDWKVFSASIKNPLMKFFVWGKWIMLQTIHKELKKFDKHLVPSDFMQGLVKNSKNTVAVLPHFTQE